MKFVENLSERSARKIAQTTSRRSFIGRLGALLVGVGAVPLLPVARADSQKKDDKSSNDKESSSEKQQQGYPGVAPQVSTNPEEEGDPTHCDYWRYCGIAGSLCTCCGGSANACPPGTEMSLLSWIGTCRNPTDGKNYIISYNDCCGKTTCTRCLCGPINPSDKPVVRPQSSSHYIWCLGTKNSHVTCSTAVVVGVALDQG